LILQDPDVESLSSFIGIDAQNSTLNSGRIQINLKDRESAEDASAQDVIERLEPKLARVEGIQCSAAVAGSDGGRPCEPDAVSILAGGCERGRTGAVDRQDGGQAERDSGADGCGERPAEQRAARKRTW
jgi:hypothetical protein